MYYFIEARTSGTYNYLKFHSGHSESSDISPIEGWVINEDELKIIPGSYNKYVIPVWYQGDIQKFKEDYWDGEFAFDPKDKKRCTGEKLSKEWTRQ